MPLQPLPSVTLTVIGNDPNCAVVPLSRPDALSVYPVGSVPLFRVKVAPPTAPVCVNCWLKAVFTVPDAVAGFVTVMVWQAMAIEYVAAVPVQPFASVAFTVIGNEPVSVGVPGRTPAADSVRPAGSVPVLRLNAIAPMPPACVTVLLNVAETVPAP